MRTGRARECWTMAAETRSPALWMAAEPGRIHLVDERGLTADAAERVRCLYCASKPMVAMVVLSVLEARGIELDGAVVGPDGRLEAATRAQGRARRSAWWPVAELLWHRSPLIGPTIWQALRLPFGTLEPALDEALLHS